MRIWLICLSLFFVLQGCSLPKKKQEQSFSTCISIAGEPSSLDPRRARDLFSQTLVRMVFDGLTRVGKDEKTHLALAESVSCSQDIKTYRFSLRDAYWSNADPITAHDFVYAWKSVLDPHFATDLATQLYVIKNGKAAKEGKVGLEEVGVRALDDHTLEVDLEYPVPYFLELISTPVFFPINARIDKSNSTWMQLPASFVSNGPFQLKEWKHHDRIVVEKNPTYWDASAVQLLKIDLLIVTGDMGLKLFEKKQLDWTGSPLSVLPIEAIASLKEQGILKNKEMLGTHFVRVNTRSGFLKNPLLRKALAFAVDRKEIIEHVLQGNQLPATGLVPFSFGLQKEPYFSDANLSCARALFAEFLATEGINKEALSGLTLLYVTNERNHALAQAIQNQWLKLFDISIELEACERKIYFDRLSKEQYQLAFSDWIADFNDPINFLDVFRYKKASSNNTGWEDQEYAKLLSLSEIAVDPQERLDLLRRAEKLLIQHMPILPLFHYSMLYLQQPRLCNVILSSMGVVDFKWANISSSLVADGEKQ